MTSLKVFLFVYIGALSIGILARFILLSWKPYPRYQVWSRGEDVLAIMCHSGFAIWAYTLLP